MNSAYNQMPPDKPSQRLTNFVIVGQQYYFKRLFYGVSIKPAAFSSFMKSIFKPLIRKKRLSQNLDDIFIQDTTDTMTHTWDHYQKNSKLKTSKPLGTNSSFSWNQLNS